MTHIDTELQRLKSDLMEMWNLVKTQIEKSETALMNFDKDLAREIILHEKRVNVYELKIDKDCENIFALFNPVAIDLRFVLAVLKINSNLERIGDNIEGIAKYVMAVEHRPEEQLIQHIQMQEMYKVAMEMLSVLLIAFEQEDTHQARTIFKKDEILDEININAPQVTAEFIKNNPDKVLDTINALSIIRKLERVGDQSKNIAEEIIFYIEAKVLKHRSKSKRDA